MAKFARVAALAGLIPLSAACQPPNEVDAQGGGTSGNVLSGGEATTDMSSTGGEDTTGTTGTGVELDSIQDADPETLPSGVPAASRVPRLSYQEYDHSVSDLLQAKLTPSELFPAEQPNLGPYENGGQRAINERLLQEITFAAESLAEEAVADATRYAAIVGCDTSAPGCRDEFIASFGRRAYRRPLSATETTRFQTLFDQGAELIASGDAFRDGVQLVLEVVLQSAKFLYRAEQGGAQMDEAGTRLSGFEIASRLSFLFWGTGPDDVLLDAAASGALDTEAGVLAQVERLSADSRLEAKVLDFHHRWLELEGLAAAGKDATIFPQFGPELVGSMLNEADAFFKEVTLNRDGGVAELLTAPVGAVDASLAQLYGLSGDYGSSVKVVDFTPEQNRPGILTKAAFLTGHSSAASRTSPILRGVFVLRRLLCQDIPAPPPGAESEEPDSLPADELLTTRQFFTWKTSMTVCANCHTTINPVGFAFEGFDAIGQARNIENGAAVDTTGEIRLSGDTLAFSGANELVQKMAAMSRVRACYAKHWVNYAYGRGEAQGDARTMGRISRDLETSPYGVRGLLAEVAASPAFSHLPPKTD